MFTLLNVQSFPIFTNFSDFSDATLRQSCFCAFISIETKKIDIDLFDNVSETKNLLYTMQLLTF